MPDEMMPAAMPAVTELERPANRSASAKMTRAAEPSKGSSVEAASDRSSITMPCAKKVLAASTTMALLMAQPTPIEKSVSTNSWSRRSWMTASPLSSKCWLWITSECRNRLCGMITAPSTLTMIALEPSGKVGTTQPAPALAQSTWTMASSARNEMPMIETNPMIHFSILP